jgi:hypothetical protein
MRWFRPSKGRYPPGPFWGDYEIPAIAHGVAQIVISMPAEGIGFEGIYRWPWAVTFAVLSAAKSSAVIPREW